MSEYEPQPVPVPEQPNRSPSALPVPKVTAATFGAGLATIIVAVIDMVTSADIPAGLEGGIATVAAFAAGYLTPPRG